MAIRNYKKKYSPVYLPDWLYLGGESITPGGVSALATIPSEANIFEIAAEAQDCYYAINGVTAAVTSPGYIVTAGREIVGPLGNLTRLAVFSAAGGVVHLQYFREA